MQTEDLPVVLSPLEIELLLASLAHYEDKFREHRSESIARAILELRKKLAAA